MLRDFQEELDRQSDQAWAEGAQNVMIVAPTGSGKTVVMSHKARKLDVPTCAIAHRQELVSQIALAFNRDEIPHGIIAPKSVIREIVAAEMETHGRSFYNPLAHVRVAGIDTLGNRDKASDRWFSQVQLVEIDEGHHVLADNKWGRAQTELFPTARGLYFTAHALRADGAGLGRNADGLVDRLVLGPCAREIIDRGFLTDYRVICPPSDISLQGVDISSSTGDFNSVQVREKVHASGTIVGDIVKHYRKFADGELGITFAVDVQAAHEIAEAFKAQKVPAAVITAKTGIAERSHYMKQFRQRQLIQLVNVDCLGEGTDVPACTVVSMARPSASFQLTAQQFGRMLRIMVSDDLNRRWHSFTDAERLAYIAASSKPKGILIDHVGNIATADGKGLHGLPDKPRAYSLDRREKKRGPSDIPLRTCLNPDCFQPYESYLSECPYCGSPKPAPLARGTPMAVEGNLIELDPEVLKQLRGEIARIDSYPKIPANVSAITATAINNNHLERQRVQFHLRDAIALWAGWQTHLGRDAAESYRRFWYTFATDVATAQTLNSKDATELEQRIRAQLSSNNIVKAT
jgi:DNA repair protein RadD